jgi:two-component system, NtrC family, sensor kinase
LEMNFETVLVDNTKLFSEKISRIYFEMFGLPILSISEPLIVQSGIPLEGYIASLLFIGTTFGEFLIQISETSLEKIFSEFSDPTQKLDAFSESLNMAAGQCLPRLGKFCEKITITAPRVSIGKVRYPKVKSATCVLETAHGQINCILFLDKMKLDVAVSYKQIISDLSKVNDGLNEANQKLQFQQAQLVHSEKMASLGMVAAGVAHEINNPLSFVLSNVEILEDYNQAMTGLLTSYENVLKLTFGEDAKSPLKDSDQMKKLKADTDIDFIMSDSTKLIGESKNGLERIKIIVKGLKRFSRMGENEITSVQLNTEIESALLVTENQLKSKCKIERNLGDIPPIRCEAGQMSQVFANLLLNAYQAMPEKEGWIRISSFVEGSWIVIRVKDNGKGIEPSNIKNLFTPFYTTKPIGEGTGLGLAISHGIVHKHGGTIEVESEVAKGTTFTVKLPVTT